MSLQGGFTTRNNLRLPFIASEGAIYRARLHAVRLGVALLPETLRPVRVSAGDPSAWPAPALLVPSPEGDDPETLVVPTTGYRSGTRLTLWDGPPRDTRLGVRLAGSPDIAQYTLRPAV